MQVAVPGGSVRAIAIASGVVALVAYVLLFLASGLFAPVHERVFGPSGGSPSLRLYVEPTAIEPVRDAMHVRVSAHPPSATATALLAERELTLLLVHDRGGERIEMHAGTPWPSASIELDLEGGDVGWYPFDVYRASLLVRCTEPSSATVPVPVPVEVTVWERVLGYRVRAHEEAADTPADKRLVFEIRRSLAFEYVALIAYGAMAVLAGAAVSICVLVARRVRRAESTLLGALGTIVFALPALRNAIPGAPPLGVLADVLVFFWAELAAVVAVAATVVTWARRGPDV